MEMNGQDGGYIGTYSHKASISDWKLSCGHGAIDTQGKQDIDAQAGEEI